MLADSPVALLCMPVPHGPVRLPMCLAHNKHLHQILHVSLSRLTVLVSKHAPELGLRGLCMT